MRKTTPWCQAPVYLLNGERFSNGYADMWDGTTTGVRPNIDQFGALKPFAGPWAWTGTDVDGTEHPFGSLGTSEVWAGRYDSLFSDWIIWATSPRTSNSRSMR